MEEDIKVELERARLKNYVLQKENDILLGTIGIVTKEKETLLSEIEKIKNSRGYKITQKINHIMRRDK